MAAAVKALCSALSDINSDIHLFVEDDISHNVHHKKENEITYAIVNGTAVPPIDDRI
jgi:hypothetical protein